MGVAVWWLSHAPHLPLKDLYILTLKPRNVLSYLVQGTLQMDEVKDLEM